MKKKKHAQNIRSRSKNRRPNNETYVASGHKSEFVRLDYNWAFSATFCRRLVID